MKLCPVCKSNKICIASCECDEECDCYDVWYICENCNAEWIPNNVEKKESKNILHYRELCENEIYKEKYNDTLKKIYEDAVQLHDSCNHCANTNDIEKYPDIKMFFYKCDSVIEYKRILKIPWICDYCKKTKYAGLTIDKYLLVNEDIYNNNTICNIENDIKKYLDCIIVKKNDIVCGKYTN